MIDVGLSLVWLVLLILIVALAVIGAYTVIDWIVEAAT